jgi:hypothetical protein
MLLGVRLSTEVTSCKADLVGWVSGIFGQVAAVSQPVEPDECSTGWCPRRVVSGEGLDGMGKGEGCS